MTTKFACDFCTVLLLTADAGREHESGCDGNPDNRTCWTCEHFGFVVGCRAYGDQQWRSHCAKWELLRRLAARRQSPARN